MNIKHTVYFERGINNFSENAAEMMALWQSKIDSIPIEFRPDARIEFEIDDYISIVEIYYYKTESVEDEAYRLHAEREKALLMTKNELEEMYRLIAKYVNLNPKGGNND